MKTYADTNAEINNVLKVIAKIRDEETLRNLNRAVVAQLRATFTKKAQKAAAKFDIGQEVTFRARGEIQRGVIKKINLKSIKVAVPGKAGYLPMTWNVSPTFLRAA